MAITPLTLSGTSKYQSNLRPDEHKVISHTRKNYSSQSSVVSITDSMQTTKSGSLLYQIVSRLLSTEQVSTEQDKLLSESLERLSESSSVEQEEAKSVRIFNSLLMMRLINNKQFITQLSEANTYLTSAKNGDRVVQMTDYKR